MDGKLYLLPCMHHMCDSCMEPKCFCDQETKGAIEITRTQAATRASDDVITDFVIKMNRLIQNISVYEELLSEFKTKYDNICTYTPRLIKSLEYIGTDHANNIINSIKEDKKNIETDINNIQTNIEQIFSIKRVLCNRLIEQNFMIDDVMNIAQKIYNHNYNSEDYGTFSRNNYIYHNERGIHFGTYESDSRKRRYDPFRKVDINMVSVSNAKKSFKVNISQNNDIIKLIKIKHECKNILMPNVWYDRDNIYIFAETCDSSTGEEAYIQCLFVINGADYTYTKMIVIDKEQRKETEFKWRSAREVIADI